MSRKSTILRIALGVFVGFAAAAHAGAADTRESVEQRLCIDACRNDFLQCMMDGGFEDEGPYQACRSELQTCRDRCAQRPA